MSKYEISQQFFFDAAHTLKRVIEQDESERVHGHTYHAEVTVAGIPDITSGMIVDLGLLRRDMEKIRKQLDHRMLDAVDGLGIPTLENLCTFIALKFKEHDWNLCRVTVWRTGIGDRCTLII